MRIAADQCFVLFRYAFGGFCCFLFVPVGDNIENTITFFAPSSGALFDSLFAHDEADGARDIVTLLQPECNEGAER